jgi:putative ABC transport system permease protein
MDGFLRDIRYGLRGLLKRPGFSVIALVTLALGIGANTAIFSVVNTVLLRPLPYREPGRLVMIWGNFRSLNMMRLGASAPEFVDFKNQGNAFSNLAAFRQMSFNITGEPGPQRVSGLRVTTELFSVLGVTPLAGRALVADDENPGHDRVAVISQRLWQTRFGGNPNLTQLLGHSITLDGENYTVVGIMPRDFQFPFGEDETQRADIWVPAVFSPGELNDRDRYNYQVIGRLKPGVKTAEARVEMDTIGRRLEQQYPRSYRGPKGEDGGWQVTVTSLEDEVVGNVRLLLWVLLGVVAFVMLIACANVTNLSLARASTRQREIAIRTALGASRGLVIRQMLTESALLGLLGGALALPLAAWGIELLIALGPRDIPRLSEVKLDLRVLGFTLGVSLFTGLLSGIAPAWRSAGARVNDALKEASKSMTSGAARQRLRSLLVVSEIALALVLLIGAGLMLKSFRRLLAVDPGFNSDRVLTAQVWLPPARYAEPGAKLNFFAELLTRIRALPGVESASFTTGVPLTGVTFGAPFSIEGRPFDPTGKPPHAYIRTIAPEYFRTLDIALQQGRDFNDQDTGTSTLVVIINQTFARDFFNGSAIGKRFKIGGPQSPRPWLQIAGVVRDVKADGLDAQTVPELYLPFSQNTGPAMTLVARTAGDPTGSVAAVRREVLSIDKDQPVYNIRMMNQLLGASIAQRRFNMLLLGAFAVLALLLAVLGLFGVLAYSVAQRTHEIGLRLALGAQPSDVLKLIVGNGMTLALIGVAIGLAGAFALTRLLTTLLFGVTPTDAATFATVSVGLMVVALFACFIPARRATKVDPLVALRYE